MIKQLNNLSPAEHHFVKIGSNKLMVNTALRIAHTMLVRIANGESYSALEYHDKLQAIRRVVDELNKYGD